MARSVKDAAYVLSAIAGKDPADNYTSAIPFDCIPDYVAACNASSLHGARIGIPRNIIFPTQDEAPVLAAFARAVQVIQTAGATVADANVSAATVNETQTSKIGNSVLAADFVADIQKYIAGLATNPNNLTDLASVRAYTQADPREDNAVRGTGVWDQSLALGFDNTDPQFWPLYQEGLRLAGPEGILGALKNNSLDALIVPTDFASDLPARVGTPIVTVPRKCHRLHSMLLF